MFLYSSGPGPPFCAVSAPVVSRLAQYIYMVDRLEMGPISGSGITYVITGYARKYMGHLFTGPISQLMGSFISSHLCHVGRFPSVLNPSIELLPK